MNVVHAPQGIGQGIGADTALDVVIKTRARDLVPFLQLQADLVTHSRLRGRTYVIVPSAERDDFAAVLESRNTLLTAEEVAAAAGFHGEIPDTWFTQQVLKIAAVNIIEHEYYLILDSATLLGFDFDEQYFVLDSKYVYAVNDFRDVAWELQSRNFLQLQTPGRLAGFRASNQIFCKPNVVSLIHRVESLYRANIVRVLLEHCDDRSTQFWTEFALYGAYVQSLEGTPGHRFVERHDLVHFSARREFSHLLQDIEADAPLMIKFHRRRPRRYELAVDEYARHVSAIKRAYRRRLEVGAAPCSTGGHSPGG